MPLDGSHAIPTAVVLDDHEIAGTTVSPITLTYWPAANPPETRLAMRLATQWNAENPGVQVRVQPLPAGRSSEEVLLAAIVAKATPDVSSNVSSALAVVNQEILASLDESLRKHHSDPRFEIGRVDLRDLAVLDTGASDT